MANRIVGQTYIVDTQSGNTALPGKNLFVRDVVFFANDTSAVLSLSYANTTDLFVKFDARNTNSDQPTEITVNQRVETLKVPLLTAGTAWLYLE